MTQSIRLTAQAQQDVLDIWEYIAADNISAADRLIDRFTEMYEKLVRHPGMGIEQEQYQSGLRCFPIGKYIIFYRTTDDGIEVYRVLHGARRLEDLL